MPLPVHTLRNLTSLLAVSAFVAAMCGLAAVVSPLMERIPG